MVDRCGTVSVGSAITSILDKLDGIFSLKEEQATDLKHMFQTGFGRLN